MSQQPYVSPALLNALLAHAKTSQESRENAVRAKTCLWHVLQHVSSVSDTPNPHFVAAKQGLEDLVLAQVSLCGALRVVVEAPLDESPATRLEKIERACALYETASVLSASALTSLDSLPVLKSLCAMVQQRLETMRSVIRDETSQEKAEPPTASIDAVNEIAGLFRK